MMKKSQNTNKRRVFGAKAVAVLLALALVFAVAIGTTLSLLVWQSEEDRSSFVPADADCGITVENGAYYIENNGDTDVYVRALFTVTWKTDDGEIYGKTLPVETVDYRIAINTDDWFVGDDGFYYCRYAIAPDDRSPAFIKDFIVADSGDDESESMGNDVNAPRFPEDYDIVLDVIAGAIQSEPSDAVEDYWNIDAGFFTASGK